MGGHKHVFQFKKTYKEIFFFLFLLRGKKNQRETDTLTTLETLYYTPKTMTDSTKKTLIDNTPQNYSYEQRIRQKGSMYIKITKTGTESVCVFVCVFVRLHKPWLSKKGEWIILHFQISHKKGGGFKYRELCCSWTGKKVDTHLQKKPSSQVKSVCVCVCVIKEIEKKHVR